MAQAKPAADHQDFLSVRQAARLAGVTTDYIGFLCRSGALPGRRVGRRWAIDAAALGASFDDLRARKQRHRAALKRERKREYRRALRARTT